MKLYWKFFKTHLKSNMEYKTSFILSFISQFFVFFTYYFIIISLFQKFSNIKGWTVYEVLLCFSIIQFGFSFCETFFRGIDKFDDLIISGDYDRMLIRPIGLLKQVIISDVDLVKLSRILQSIVVLIIAIINLHIEWNLLKIICLLFMLISSVVLFFGIFVLAASYCFVTVKGLEIRNLFTDGGKHAAQYPIGIFKKGFAFIFTYIVPYACVNYYPLLYLLNKSTNIYYMFLPLLVILFIIPCIYIFKLGNKKYTSVGS